MMAIVRMVAAANEKLKYVLARSVISCGGEGFNAEADDDDDELRRADF